MFKLALRLIALLAIVAFVFCSSNVVEEYGQFSSDGSFSFQTTEYGWPTTCLKQSSINAGPSDSHSRFDFLWGGLLTNFVVLILVTSIVFARRLGEKFNFNCGFVRLGLVTVLIGLVVLIGKNRFETNRKDTDIANKLVESGCDVDFGYNEPALTMRLGIGSLFPESYKSNVRSIRVESISLDEFVTISRSLKSLDKLDLCGSDLSDENIGKLCSLRWIRSLSVLDVSETEISSLDNACKFIHLTDLVVADTNFSRQSLNELVDFPALEFLDISNTGVDSLTPLRSHPAIATVIAFDCALAKHEIESLREVGIEVVHDHSVDPVKRILTDIENRLK